MADPSDIEKLMDNHVERCRCGDAAGCAVLFSPKAGLYAPFGPPAIGRAAIAAMHCNRLAEGASNNGSRCRARGARAIPTGA